MRALACLPLLAIASASNAQWSCDPAVNLQVTDAMSGELLAKLAPTLDGGCYVSWLDDITNGFDVRLQKLDLAGREMFRHNGLRIADRNLRWTDDYSLNVDASGNALLAFRSALGDSNVITAAKVSPTGVLLWGAFGIQLTDSTYFVSYAKIAGTSDGGAVVAWTQDSTVRLQKLDAGGAPLWDTGVTLSPATGSYFVSDLHASETDVILSFVHQTGDLNSSRYLMAQKLDSAGNLLWGAGHVTIFDAGRIQNGYLPGFIPDGSGGAVFSWYDAYAELQCYAQHLRANGTEAFPHNGSAVSTNMTSARVTPSAAFNPSTEETFVFWKEENLGQTRFGVYAQKLDVSGNRQWTDEGVVIVPVGSEDCGNPHCMTEGTGAFVFWVQSPAYEQDLLLGARLNSAGVIDILPFSVASTPSGKSSAATARSTAGFTILAWSDARAGEADIYMQNVLPDGTLGSPLTGGAVEGARASSLFLGAPRPNPMSDITRIEYSAAAPGKVVLEIYDIRGRVVRTLSAGDGPRSETMTWDGRDDSGARLACGVYFVRLGSGGTARSARVIIVR